MNTGDRVQTPFGSRGRHPVGSRALPETARAARSCREGHGQGTGENREVGGALPRQAAMQVHSWDRTVARDIYP